MAENNTLRLSDDELAALMQQRRQARVDEVTRELGIWLGEHDVMLVGVPQFTQDGRIVVQVQVVLK